MKALVIAPQPFFSPRGTPLSVYYRTLVTVELGVEVDLLTYGEGQDVDIPGVRIYRIPSFHFVGSVKVGPSALKFFFDIFIFIWTVALIVRNRYDFVHAHEEAVFFCCYLKSIFGFKLVYDMHSSLPEQLINFHYTRSRVLTNLFKYLEKTSLASADAVITICPELANQATHLIPDSKRHFLIENSIFEEVQLKKPPTCNLSTPQMAVLPKERPIVAYAGTLETYQGLDILIPAFAKVLESKPDAFLLILGGSVDQVSRFEKLAAECGLGAHCCFTGRVDGTIVKQYLSRASVLVSPRKNGTNTPLKIYEQLASGRPLVATRIPSHTQVLNDQVCFLVEPNPDSMAKGIIRALTDCKRCAQVVANARDLYEKKYSRVSYVKKMSQLLGSLI